MGPELARKWMKDPDIYTLELASENRSKGAKAGHTEEGRYQAPETDPEKIKAFMEANQEEIDKINGKCGK